MQQPEEKGREKLSFTAVPEVVQEERVKRISIFLLQPCQPQGRAEAHSWDSGRQGCCSGV